MPKPRISREDFDALVRTSGLPLTDRQKAELHGAYGSIEGMIEHVRGDGMRSRDVEPALIFKPDRS